MNKTRRTRRGGAGFLETLGLRRPRSPFTGPTVSKNEKKLLAEIKQYEEGIPAVKRLGKLEGFNVTNSVKDMEKYLAGLKKQLATLRGENTITMINNPGLSSEGGRRKTRRSRKHKQKHKSTRRH